MKLRDRDAAACRFTSKSPIGAYIEVLGPFLFERMKQSCDGQRLRVIAFGFVRLAQTTVRTLQYEVFDRLRAATTSRKDVVDVKNRPLAELAEMAVLASAAVAFVYGLPN